MAKTSLSENLTIRLVSPSREVNARAVAASMSAIVALLEDIQRETFQTNPIAIKARPFAKGSFEIPLELLAYTGILLLQDVPLIEQTISTLKNCLSYVISSRRSLRPSQSLSNVTVRGDVTMIQGDVVNNIYIPSADAINQLSNASGALLADDSIESLEILKGKRSHREKIIEIRREEFDLLAAPQDDEESLPRRDKKSRATLVIAAPDLLGAGKWRFTLKGTTIWAGFRDEAFLRNVSQGLESFKAGDQLVVDLITHQALNEISREYENKAYTIDRVISHEKARRQRRFPD